MENVTKAVSMDAKQAGDLIYMIGDTKDELGGSHYLETLGIQSPTVPTVDAIVGKKLMNPLSNAIASGLVKACHDCSEGGLAVAAAEMAFAGELGMKLHLPHVPSSDNLNRDDKILFSESNSRFIVEIDPQHQAQFEKILAGNKFGLMGKTQLETTFEVIGLNNNTVIKADIFELKESWQQPLK
jgi:phosphoribosylformylglycinamidine synthase